MIMYMSIRYDGETYCSEGTECTQEEFDAAKLAMFNHIDKFNHFEIKLDNGGFFIASGDVLKKAVVLMNLTH